MSELHNRIVLSVAEKKLNSRVSHIEKALNLHIYFCTRSDVPLLAWSFTAVCILAFFNNKQIWQYCLCHFFKTFIWLSYSFVYTIIHAHSIWINKVHKIINCFQVQNTFIKRFKEFVDKNPFIDATRVVLVTLQEKSNN